MRSQRCEVGICQLVAVIRGMAGFRQVILTEFTSTLILSCEDYEERTSDFEDVRTADGRSLASFLLIREIRRELVLVQSYMENPIVIPNSTVICEIVDSKNSVSLLRELGCDSYVMSNDIVSSAIAQVRGAAFRLVDIVLRCGGRAGDTFPVT